MPSSVTALITSGLQEHVNAMQALQQGDHAIKQIAQISELVVRAYRAGKKVILFGNGGSAADAQHLAAELVGKFRLDRDPLPAFALTVNTSTLTAVGNDYSFGQVFARQVEALGEAGDVAIGISTSGDSENVVQALMVARRGGMVTVGLTGETGGRMKDVVDCCLCVPSKDIPRIQEVHITVGHMICEIVEKRLFGQLGGAHRAVFLDRDGVINRKAPEGSYVKNWHEFEFLPGVVEAISELREAGFLVMVVTNQRGVARGVMTEEDLTTIHARMEEELRGGRAALDGVYFCPHDIDDGCSCRKPRPGLLFRAARQHDIDLSQSWMVGDSQVDIQAGLSAGCRTVLVQAEGVEGCISNGVTPDERAVSLHDAARIILHRSPSQPGLDGPNCGEISGGREL